MKNYLLLALICLSCLSALGQSESVWVQSGKVIDAKSHKAIAHVSVTDRKVGTVTNEEGEFTLKLKSEPKEIVFSCIGYQTRRLSPEALKTTANKIMMTPSSVVLSEVVVKAYDAKAYHLRHKRHQHRAQKEGDFSHTYYKFEVSDVLSSMLY